MLIGYRQLILDTYNYIGFALWHNNPLSSKLVLDLAITLVTSTKVSLKRIWVWTIPFLCSIFVEKKQTFTICMCSIWKSCCVTHCHSPNYTAYMTPERQKTLCCHDISINDKLIVLHRCQSQKNPSLWVIFTLSMSGKAVSLKHAQTFIKSP